MIKIILLFILLLRYCFVLAIKSLNLGTDMAVLCLINIIIHFRTKSVTRLSNLIVDAQSEWSMFILDEHASIGIQNFLKKLFFSLAY